VSVLTKKLTGFGIKRLDVAAVPTAPGSTPDWINVPLIEQASYKHDVKEVELWGDDRYQGTFYHSATGKISAKANRMALAVFELLSGVSGVSTADDGETLYFGTEDELLPPRIMVRAQVPVRNDNGTRGTMTVYWFQTEVKTLWENLPGAERAKIQEVPITFNCFSSEQDEKGDPLPAHVKTAFGKLAVK
jgi:hypothetical protein